MLILAAALLAALPGCDAGLPEEVAGCDYIHRQARFAMDVPRGWRVRESRGAVTVFVLAPASAPGRANVTVAIEPAGRFPTAEALARTAAQRLRRLEGLKRLGTDKRTLADGTRALIATFEHTSAGAVVRQRQMYLVAGGQAFTVTATAAPPETFSEHEEAFEIVLRSFRAGW
ncbi:MAG: DcrB-related protein [Planctomycetota bacterium]|nr:DcrB-related protein [Planctomycetota bacterium]